MGKIGKTFAVLFILLTLSTAIFATVGVVMDNVSALSVAQAAPQKTLAKAAYLIEPTSGTVMLSENETTHLPIASMVKIMTTLLVFEEIENGRFTPDSDIFVSENAASMGGSQVFLEGNTTHKLRELIKSIIIASANDSCVAVAEAISGSEANFVQKMNERAAMLKMDNTVFATSTGLPAPSQYSCAKDVATMLGELVKHQDYFEYSGIWMENYVHPDGRETEMANTNKLIRFYKGCDGGKTGFTNEAMFCVAATASREGMRLISVIIGAENSKMRFAEASRLLNEGFAGYENKRIAVAGEPLGEIELKRGVKPTAQYTIERDLYAVTARGKDAGVSLQADIPESIKAPMAKGEIIGRVAVVRNGVVIDEANVVLAEDAEKGSLFDWIRNYWFHRKTMQEDS